MRSDPDEARPSRTRCLLHASFKAPFRDQECVFVRVVQFIQPCGSRSLRVASVTADELLICDSEGRIYFRYPLRAVVGIRLQQAGGLDEISLRAEGMEGEMRFILVWDDRNLEPDTVRFVQVLQTAVADAGGALTESGTESIGEEENIAWASRTARSLVHPVAVNAVLRTLGRSHVVHTEDADALDSFFSHLQHTNPSICQLVSSFVEAADKCRASMHRLKQENESLVRQLAEAQDMSGSSPGPSDTSNSSGIELRREVAQARARERFLEERLAEAREEIAALRARSQLREGSTSEPMELSAALQQIDLLNDKLYDLRARHRDAEELRQQLWDTEQERNRLRAAVEGGGADDDVDRALAGGTPTAAPMPPLSTHPPPNPPKPDIFTEELPAEPGPQVFPADTESPPLPADSLLAAQLTAFVISVADDALTGGEEAEKEEGERCEPASVSPHGHEQQQQQQQQQQDHHDPVRTESPPAAVPSKTVPPTQSKRRVGGTEGRSCWSCSP